jgi:hypothetical protein
VGRGGVGDGSGPPVRPPPPSRTVSPGCRRAGDSTWYSDSDSEGTLKEVPVGGQQAVPGPGQTWMAGKGVWGLGGSARWSEGGSPRTADALGPRFGDLTASRPGAPPARRFPPSTPDSEARCPLPGMPAGGRNRPTRSHCDLCPSATFCQ